MLQTHLIAELLGMEAYDFEKIDQDEKEIVLTVRMQRRTQECPACLPGRALRGWVVNPATPNGHLIRIMPDPRKIP